MASVFLRVFVDLLWAYSSPSRCRLPGQQAPGTSLPPPLQPWDYTSPLPCSAFSIRVLEFKLRSLCLQGMHITRLSHCPRVLLSFVFQGGLGGVSLYQSLALIFQPFLLCVLDYRRATRCQFMDSVFPVFMVGIHSLSPAQFLPSPTHLKCFRDVFYSVRVSFTSLAPLNT